MTAWFGRIAEQAARAAGSVWAIVVTAIGLPVSLWLAGLDATNFTVSIVSLLLLFLIQNTQNRDSLALETKLDELIRSSNARNLYIGLDRRTEPEIKAIRDGEP